ncbi:MAG TPA: AsmA-like C-terminal region-containing protein [Bacteroidales bacterium]|nr:AsmA family protein [Bacteroidales bacterium]HNY51822.1 AsmA-like C-terminal region-containing protein [Bacteroidales bacterium]HOG55961.1 AsmA-like C-terminal region-containing protein [Bacteroidales bacterium]HPX43004.1 AsmA-like C-terminal region-containing protein [Bacteroidales bacterium]HQB86530.1 AsmA-like C-terminal region-containing protein [Bacteroidales bacterium]
MMKKASSIILKSLLGIVLLILVLLFTVPVIFKGKIKEKVVSVINESVNARVSFGDYKLGFFKNFPNLTFSMNDFSVAGTGDFESDTLATAKSINLIFNLSSLFGKEGYEVRSILIDAAKIKTLVLEDGSANWDIMKESDETESEGDSDSDIKILLREVKMLNSSFSYIDRESDMAAWLDDLSGSLSGDLTGSKSDLVINLNSDDFTFEMEGMKYISRVKANAIVNVLADLDSMIFRLRDNTVSLNDLQLKLAGTVIMPEDDIETDLTFMAEETSFKSLISLIPAFYMKDFQDLRADGSFNLSGSAKGVYSSADSTMPDISLNLSVKDGLISYPALPEQIRRINVESAIFVDGKDMDKTRVDVTGFHFELAGNPFDMRFYLRTPISDPDIDGSARGKIDLGALSKAVPMDSLELSGLIDIAVDLSGRMSMLEKSQYDRFQASGNIGLKDMTVLMTGYPGISIREADMAITPAYAELKKAELNIGSGSDFSLGGKLQNYIPYMLKDETISGNLSLYSRQIDMTEIMEGMSSDTEDEDTTSLAVIKVPENIDFDFRAKVDKFSYNKINAENVSGHIVVKDGILSFRDTGMDLLGGKVAFNAAYDTRDTLNPFVNASLSVNNLAVKDAFETFNTIRMLAPTAKGVDGKFAFSLNFSSLLQKDFMPRIASITGDGKMQSSELTLVESAVFNTMKEVLKLGQGYTNTFKDLNLSFRIREGRIFVNPFNTRVGNIKMNVSGDQGLDQTVNYVIRTEIPRADLGNAANSLIDGLSAQASVFGLTVKPSDVIKVNVNVTGTFLKPLVKPFFGESAPESLSAGIRETAGESVKEKVEEARDKVKSEAEIQGDRLVQEAEETGQKLRDEAASAAEKIRQEARAQADRLIREAESKGPVAKLAAQKAADSVVKEADRRADQLIREADEKAIKLVDEAKSKREELINKI